VLDFLPAPDWKQVILDRVASGSEQPYEMVGVRKDGSRLSVEIHARGTVFHGRQARVAAVRDITERKLLERQTMELMHEQAARSAAEIAGRRAELLAEASRVLGTSFDYETTLETLAHLAVPRLADFCTVDMAEGDAVFRRLGVAHAVEGGEALLRRLDHFTAADLSERHPLIRVLMAGEPVLIRDIPDGALDNLGMPPERLETLKQLDPHSLICVPLMASGRVIGAMTLVSTVSERRFDSDDLAMAEELARRAGLAVENARLFREATAATVARDEMLGVVAHDLRNPLNTIMMASDIVMELPSTSPLSAGRRSIEMIRRAADRMNRLIQDLLDVKRIESGGLSVEPRPQSVTAVVCEAVEMLRPLATGSSLKLRAEVPADLPQAQIDPPRIHQVLSNLVGNSIKFTPAGGTITVRAERWSAEVRITVLDTGPGIAPEQLPHLFGRYWQGNRKDRRGIGLGLAIAKGIVEAHRGRIWVESVVGQGSRFHFTLPISS
jgi:signal transduction histidine kinase